MPLLPNTLTDLVFSVPFVTALDEEGFTLFEALPDNFLAVVATVELVFVLLPVVVRLLVAAITTALATGPVAGLGLVSVVDFSRFDTTFFGGTLAWTGGVDCAAVSGVLSFTPFVVVVTEPFPSDCFASPPLLLLLLLLVLVLLRGRGAAIDRFVAVTGSKALLLDMTNVLV